MEGIIEEKGQKHTWREGDYGMKTTCTRLIVVGTELNTGDAATVTEVVGWTEEMELINQQHHARASLHPLSKLGIAYKPSHIDK